MYEVPADGVDLALTTSIPTARKRRIHRERQADAETDDAGSARVDGFCLEAHAFSSKARPTE
jgi:hypothetical protein